jgi:hypothetical protein
LSSRSPNGGTGAPAGSFAEAFFAEVFFARGFLSVGSLDMRGSIPPARAEKKE